MNENKTLEMNENKPIEMNENKPIEMNEKIIEENDENDDENDDENEENALSLDPTFLAALPDELRSEVLQLHISTLIHTSKELNNEGSTISQEFLDALPLNIRKEVLEKEKKLLESQEKESKPTINTNIDLLNIINTSTTNPPNISSNTSTSNAPNISSSDTLTNPSNISSSETSTTNPISSNTETIKESTTENTNSNNDMDVASFIATLPPDLREETLLSLEDSVVLTLPQEMQLEVNNLRRSYFTGLRFLEDNYHFSRMDDEEEIPIVNTKKSKKIETVEDKKGKNIIKEEYIIEILKTIYFSQDLSIIIEKIFNNISHSEEIRKYIIFYLMGILENIDTKNYIPEKLIKLINNKMVDEIKNKKLEKPSTYIPTLVIKRILEILTFLIKSNNKVLEIIFDEKFELDISNLTIKDEKKIKNENMDNILFNKFFEFLSMDIYKNKDLNEKLLELIYSSLNLLTKWNKQNEEELKILLSEEKINEKDEIKNEKEEIKNEEKINEKNEEKIKEKNEEKNEEKIKEKNEEKIKEMKKIKEENEKKFKKISTIENTKSIVKIISEDNSDSELITKYSISILNIISQINEKREIILTELTRNIISKSKLLDSYFILLDDNKTMTKIQFKEFNQFYKLLKIYNQIYSIEKKNKKKKLKEMKKILNKEEENKKNEEEKDEEKKNEEKKEEILKFDSLNNIWDSLENYIKKEYISEKISTESSIKILPLIQAYFSFNNCFELNKHKPIDTLSQNYLKKEKIIQKSRLEIFLENNRKLLNLIISNNPNLLQNELSLLIKFPKYLDFENKKIWFQQNLELENKNYRNRNLRINVRRNNIFVDSFFTLKKTKPHQLKGQLNVRFQGEEGVDAGGVSREWYLFFFKNQRFLLLSKEMFNPNYSLFVQSSDKATFQPSPKSSINPEHLDFFKFIGTVIGLAILNEKLVDCYFTRSFYKHILGII
jgi:E3 ubiquitin-protein ligase HUWE1